MILILDYLPANNAIAMILDIKDLQRIFESLEKYIVKRIDPTRGIISNKSQCDNVIVTLTPKNKNKLLIYWISQ